MNTFLSRVTLVLVSTAAGNIWHSDQILFLVNIKTVLFCREGTVAAVFCRKSDADKAFVVCSTLGI